MSRRRGPNRRTSALAAAGTISGFLVNGLLSGCGGSGSIATNDPSAPRVARGQYETLRFTLSTTKSSFARGEEIPFVFTIFNVGTGPVLYNEGVEKYRTIVSQKNTPVWDSGFSYAYISGPQTTLAPGESRRCEFVWSQKNRSYDNASEVQVPPGVYSVKTYANMGLFGGNFPEQTRQAMSPEVAAQLSAGPLNITIR